MNCGHRWGACLLLHGGHSCVLAPLHHGGHECACGAGVTHFEAPPACPQCGHPFNPGCDDPCCLSLGPDPQANGHRLAMAASALHRAGGGVLHLGPGVIDGGGRTVPGGVSIAGAGSRWDPIAPDMTGKG